MMTDDILEQLREGMGYLDEAARQPQRARRDGLNAAAAARILPFVGKIKDRTDYDHVLEDAARAGATEIILALPIRSDESFAHLTMAGWTALAKNLPLEVCPDVEARGLFFNLAAIISLCEHGGDEAKRYVIETLAKSDWRIEDRAETLAQTWCKIECTKTAVAFMKAQLEHHPETTRDFYLEAVSLRDEHRTYMHALALECLLGLDQSASFAYLTEAGRNLPNHHRLALREVCADPALLHRALSKLCGPKKTPGAGPIATFLETRAQAQSPEASPGESA